LDDSLRLFLGYLNGRPVATAGARISHSLNDVEWVANLATSAARASARR